MESLLENKAVYGAYERLAASTQWLAGPEKLTVEVLEWPPGEIEWPDLPARSRADAHRNSRPLDDHL